MSPISDACRSVYAEDPLPDDQNANRCLEYQQSADVALLYRAGDKAAATDLATDVTDLLRRQTYGLLQLDITPVPISTDAARAYDAEYAAKDCVPADDYRGWSSSMTLESDTMPKLDVYDAAIGVNTLPACDGTLGASISVNGAVEVFGVHVTDTDTYSTETEQGSDYVAGTTAHEIAHLFGVGHAGTMTSSDATAQESNGQIMRRSFGVLADDAPKDGPIDIVSWVNEADYYEYGEQSLMGLAHDQASIRPINTLQQYYLEWPYRTLGEDSAVRGVALEDEPAVFSADDERPLVAHMSIGGYLAPPHAEDAEDFAKFTELAFVSHETKGSERLAVDVYVAHPISRDVAPLGTIWAYDTKQFELYAGPDAQVTVDVDMTTRTISFTKHS